MQVFIRPENYDGAKLKMWLIKNVGSDPGTLRCRRGKIYVPDDVEITQVDIDQCVISEEEINQAKQQQALDKKQNLIMVIIAKQAFGKPVTQEESQLVKAFVERWGLDF